MASTVYSSGTVVASPWLNDVNTATYKSFFNVKTYGAVGDAGTNDVASITAALTALSAAGGGELFFPTGSYRINSTISVPANCTLRGGNPRTTTLYVDATFTGNAVAFTGDGASMYGIGFQATAQRTTGTYVALASNTRSNVIEDFYMSGGNIGVHIGQGGASPVLTHVNRGEVVNGNANTGAAVKVSGGNDTYLSNIFTQGISGAGTEPLCGFLLENSSAVWMYNCGALFSRVGLAIKPATGQAITWCFIHSCAFDTGVDQAISITPSGTGSVRGVTMVDSWGATSDRGIYIDKGASGVINGVELVGCRFINNNKDGAFVYGDYVNVKDCTITGNSQSGVGLYPGIVVAANTVNFALQNNHVGATYSFGTQQNYGISIGTGCNNYIITGNNLLGNGTGTLLDNSAATATTRRVQNNLGFVNSKAGVASGTTDASGDITVTHGMSGTPTSVRGQLLNVTAVGIVGVHTIGATTFKLRVFNGAAAGAALTSTAVTIAWQADF